MLYLYKVKGKILEDFYGLVNKKQDYNHYIQGREPVVLKPHLGHLQKGGETLLTTPIGTKERSASVF